MLSREKASFEARNIHTQCSSIENSRQEQDPACIPTTEVCYLCRISNTFRATRFHSVIQTWLVTRKSMRYAKGPLTKQRKSICRFCSRTAPITQAVHRSGAKTSSTKSVQRALSLIQGRLLRSPPLTLA